MLLSLFVKPAMQTTNYLLYFWVLCACSYKRYGLVSGTNAGLAQPLREECILTGHWCDLSLLGGDRLDATRKYCISL